MIGLKALLLVESESDWKIQIKNTVATHPSRQQLVHAHPADKQEKNYPTAFRRKC